MVADADLTAAADIIVAPVGIGKVIALACS